jgi:hypothetical protein
MEFQDTKAFARSKHFHSLTKDKNKYKKKAIHKQKQTPNAATPSQPTEEEQDEFGDDTDEEIEAGQVAEKGVDCSRTLINQMEEKKTSDSVTPQETPKTEPTEKRRSKFSRRVITTNDFRYEENEEEEQEPAAPDIRKLLENAAGNVVLLHLISPTFGDSERWKSFFALQVSRRTRVG